MEEGVKNYAMLTEIFIIIMFIPFNSILFMRDRIKNVVEKCRNFVRDYNNRITENEVIAQLSYNTWKTCNAILEEIEADRKSKGKPLPNRKNFWFYPKSDTRHALTELYFRDLVEIKTESELTITEANWATRSTLDADYPKIVGGHPLELLFYRLTRGTKGRKPRREDLLLEEDNGSIVVHG